MDSKICRRCNAEKPISDFYKHDRMADGHLNICKPCVTIRVKKHRKENDSVRAYDSWRYQNHPFRKEKSIQRTKEYRKKYPDRYKAHTALSNAVRDGKIKRQPCEVCGDVKSHAHHEDYSKPLDVKWLCALHHQRLHHLEDSDGQQPSALRAVSHHRQEMG